MKPAWTKPVGTAENRRGMDITYRKKAIYLGGVLTTQQDVDELHDTLCALRQFLPNSVEDETGGEA